jgi:NAD(P)-dependent dehydrogenase (short-subunit alcohol dehydrogenase family)
LKKVAIITGASKGIGLAIAAKLQQDGYIVYGTSRKISDHSQLPFLPKHLEVRSEDSVAELVRQVLGEVGRIDVLINNAGYDVYGSAAGTSMDELHAQMDVNFYGAVRMARAVLPAMKKQQSGNIINISSIGGFLSLPFNSAYAASKFAMEGYFEAMRYEVRPFGIYVSLIEPQGVNTDTLDSSIQSISNEIGEHEQQLEQMIRQMRADGKANGLPPEAVANVVLHVLTTKQPRLRYPVGGLATFMPWMKVLLPQKMFESFISSRFLK